MKKVLVVENSATIISVADSLLRQRGYDVTCISDGRKALQFVKDEKPDLVLTAIGLSGIDGLQLCKAISSDPITGGIPVVLLIGDRDSAFIENIELSGARGKLNKPFSPKELIGVVDKFTGGIKPSVARVVNQKAGEGPRLQPKVKPSEIGTATRNVIPDKQGDKKPDTVYNVDWQDLSSDSRNEFDGKGESDADDSQLVLEEDQYGLTKLPEEFAPSKGSSDDEDYDWFVGEMKREIEGTGGKGKSPSSKESAPTSSSAQGMGYKDLEPSAVSKSDTKYRQFLEQFKKDAKVITEETPTPSNIDPEWLVERVADKIAQKIIEKIDRDEIRQVINSILGDLQ